MAQAYRHKGRLSPNGKAIHEDHASAVSTCNSMLELHKDGNSVWRRVRLGLEGAHLVVE